jgi:high affinity sulfate transporter 1
MADLVEEKKSWIKRYLPITDWLPSYKREYLAGDIIAGLTVWALLVPEAMAYAGIAGVPPEYGLYAAPLALIGYAIFGTSRQLFVGPSSTVAAVSAAAVAPLAGGDQERYIALTITLALMVGALLIVGGLLRFGFIAKFFAKPVLAGFIIGLAIYIAVGQADKLVGVTAEGQNTFAEFGNILAKGDAWSWLTLLIGVAALALLFLMHEFTPRIPAALAVMVLFIILSAALNLDEHGVHVIGEIPAGMPGWSLSGVGISDIVNLMSGALGLILVAYAESIAAAKQYAAKHKYEVDPNQEMIAYGAANLGAGIFQGFAVDGSLSKTAANDVAGGRTQMVSIVCAVFTFMTILFLTGLFKTLPEAVLAAIVIHAVWGLIDFKPLRRLYRVKRIDFALALVALFGVLLLGILEGILLGIILSLIAFIQRASIPHTAVLGRDPSGDYYGDIEENPDYETIPGLIIYRFDAPIFFANAEQFADEIMELVEKADPPAKVVIIDGEMIYEMDTTATDELVKLHDDLTEAGVDVYIARLHARVLDFFRRDRAGERVLEENIFITIREAVDAFHERYPTPD